MLQPVEMNLTANIQNVDFGLFGRWLHNSWLKDLTGTTTIGAAITSSPSAGPQMIASLDIDKPSYKKNPLRSSLSQPSLDKEGLWIGRWTNAPEASPNRLTLRRKKPRRVVFGHKSRLSR